MAVDRDQEPEDHQDRYRIEHSLGRGGMGEVHLATETATGLKVALKLLPPLGFDEAEKRFQQETRIHASLEHPNLVKVMASGLYDGRPYLALEYVPGSTLAGYLEDEPALDLDFCLGVARQVTAALAYLHGRGIIHRDLKPGNILISEDGRVKVADLGLARFTDQTEMTRAGQILGTLRYLAPEVVEGARATAASDVYALGLVLYRTLAGELPYRSREWIHLLKEISGGTIRDLRDSAPHVPVRLASLVMALLGRDPTARPPAVALQQQLLIVETELDLSPEIMSRQIRVDGGPGAPAFAGTSGPAGGIAGAIARPGGPEEEAGAGRSGGGGAPGGATPVPLAGARESGSHGGTAGAPGGAIRSRPPGDEVGEPGRLPRGPFRSLAVATLEVGWGLPPELEVIRGESSLEVKVLDRRTRWVAGAILTGGIVVLWFGAVVILGASGRALAAAGCGTLLLVALGVGGWSRVRPQGVPVLILDAEGIEMPPRAPIAWPRIRRLEPVASEGEDLVALDLLPGDPGGDGGHPGGGGEAGQLVIAGLSAQLRREDLLEAVRTCSGSRAVLLLELFPEIPFEAPALAAALQDPDPAVVQSACARLRAGPERVASVGLELARAGVVGPPDARLGAILALERLGPLEDPQVRLAERSPSGAPAVASRGAAAAPPEALEIVGDLTREPEERFRLSAIRCFRRIAAGTTPAFEAALRLLRDPSPTVRREAILLIARHPRRTGVAIQVLEGLLEDPDPLLRSIAVWLIGQAETAATGAMVAAVLRRLDDPDAGVRSRTVWALERLPLDPSALAHHLVRRFSDPSSEVQVRSVRAVGRLGAGALGVVPALAAQLRSPFAEVRWQAVHALRTLAPACPAAGPPLAEAARDPDPLVRREALLAVGSLDGSTIAAGPLLTGCLADAMPQVRDAARWALSRLDRRSGDRSNLGLAATPPAPRP